MNEKEAWIEIAIMYERLKTDRNEEQAFMTIFGICHVLNEIDIDDALYLRMCDKIQDDLTKSAIGSVYLFPLDRESDHLRAEYCRHQASLL